MRLRRSLPRQAADAGLGGVRRVHREHRDWPDTVDLLPWLLAFAMAEGVVATFDWRFALLLPALLWVALACWVYLAPLPKLDRPRRRFAVCTGGLLVWTDGSAAPVAVPWETLTTPVWGAKKSVVRLSWTDGTEERTVPVGIVTAARDLGRAVERRGPVRASVTPRLTITAASAAVLALAGWVVHPWLIPAILGERPEHLKDLARLCWRQDRPYERTASYKGAAPHPLVFFREGAGDPQLATGAEGGKRPAPDQVQLVACSYPAGRVSNEPYEVCLYQGGLRTESYQGRHRLDVYEASTGRRVGRQMLTGRNEKSECPPYQVVYGKDPDPETRQADSYPPMTAYETALRHYITATP